MSTAENDKKIATVLHFLSNNN